MVGPNWKSKELIQGKLKGNQDRCFECQRHEVSVGVNSCMSVETIQFSIEGKLKSKCTTISNKDKW
jgi:hypothetical protein